MRAHVDLGLRSAPSRPPLVAGAARRLGLAARTLSAVGQVGSLLRQLVWFTWPAWPLALWTLWRWRRRLLSRHIVVSARCVAVALGACIAMGGSDRALMLGLPPLAVLAAFALPTLQRSTAAAIDWFSVFFFSIAALTIWVIYVSMQTGIPAKPAANVARLAPGYRDRAFRSSHWSSRSPAVRLDLACSLAHAAAAATRSGRAWSFRRAASACAGCS